MSLKTLSNELLRRPSLVQFRDLESIAEFGMVNEISLST